jgi:DnaJ-class molecular chaperone
MDEIIEPCRECSGSGLVDVAMPSLVSDMYDLRCYWCNGTGVEQGEDK